MSLSQMVPDKMTQGPLRFIDQPADWREARSPVEMFTLFTVIHHHTSTTNTRQTCEIKMVNVYTAWRQICAWLGSCLRVICQTGFFRNTLHDQQLYHSLVCKQRVVTLIVYRSGLRGARSVWSGGRQVAEEGALTQLLSRTRLTTHDTPVVA